MENIKVSDLVNDGELDFKLLFKMLFQNRNQILFIAFLITFFGLIFYLFSTPLYRSSVTIYPKSTQSENLGFNQLKGVASSFGLDMDSKTSLFNILDIVNSHHLRDNLIHHKWKITSSDQFQNLIQFWGFHEKFSIEDSMKIKYMALKKIKDRIFIEESSTGLIKISVLMEDKLLAADISNYIYKFLLDFSNEFHNKEAKLNRQFIENRIEEVKESLQKSEEVLKNFRQNNRSIYESPQLQLELDRLLRKVQIETQVFITLKQQLEIAKINEFKDNSSVMILDKAIIPLFKDSPNQIKILFFSFVAGLFIGVIFIIYKNELN